MFVGQCPEDYYYQLKTCGSLFEHFIYHSLSFYGMTLQSVFKERMDRTVLRHAVLIVPETRINVAFLTVGVSRTVRLAMSLHSVTKVNCSPCTSV